MRLGVDTNSRSSPLARRLRRLSRGERVEEATEFVRRFHRENGLSGAACTAREHQVARSLRKSGHYEHTPDELAYGARVAWRNHARCIGRLFWNSLEVIDRRDCHDPESIAAGAIEHIRRATDGGSIRSICTIFAPVVGDRLPAYIESRQIVQYAGYTDATPTLGDPLNVEATRIAMSLGWSPPSERGRFDVLPIIIRDSRERRSIFGIPSDAVREVDIAHPKRPEFAGLGLRWYAVPCVSGMILSIGGIDYPCAPFNGFYMSTEIASRNFGDERRYNLLPEVARCLGMSIGSARDTLWKDAALLELNRAVLHSFARDGVTMVDHHAASDQFMTFVAREQCAGRQPSADWPWIVPPQASSACPIFHLPMQDLRVVPNFYISRASDGGGLRPRRDDEPPRSKVRRRLERWRDDYREWRRSRDWRGD